LFDPRGPVGFTERLVEASSRRSGGAEERQNDPLKRVLLVLKMKFLASIFCFALKEIAKVVISEPGGR